METVAQDSGEGHCVCSLYSSKNISGKVKIRMESVTISGTLGSRSEKHRKNFGRRGCDDHAVTGITQEEKTCLNTTFAS